MEPYFFYGHILPERAQISLGFEVAIVHLSSDRPGRLKVSIINNQIAVWAYMEEEWNIYDLRNVVKTTVQNYMSLVGYIRGYAYDLDITRVVHAGLDIDQVFGIDIPCLADRAQGKNIDDELLALRAKVVGPEGVFLNRCFSDLTAAMKHADDTGFYCYRAIESLRHHCAAVHGLSGASKKAQWDKFREVAGVERASLDFVKVAADPLRHGGVSSSDTDRVGLFTTAWDIVDAYLAAI